MPTDLNHPLSKYTPKVVNAIVRMVGEGMPKSYAAQAAGISRDTLWDWECSSSDIRDAIARARARYLRKVTKALVKPIQPSFKGDPKVALDAAKFIAERQFRSEYGPSLDLRQVPAETLYELLRGGEEDIDPLPSAQELRRRKLLAEADATPAIEVTTQE
jgi:hypothetical protein